MKLITLRSLAGTDMNFKILVGIVFLCLECGALSSFSSAAMHDGIPAPRQAKAIALVDATIHPVSGPAIEKGAIVFENGRITQILTNSDVGNIATKISLAGKHIYPGMFEAHSQIGLTEIASVNATIDSGELGEINSNVKAQIAINPDSELITVTRAGGVLIAVSAPIGGMVAGKSAVIQMDGWTYEDMTISARAAMHINWPRAGGGRRRMPNPDQAAESAKQLQERVGKLRELFDEARAYQKQRAVPEAQQPFDLRLEGMQEVIDGTIPLVVRVDKLGDIQAAVAFAVEQNVRIIILGGYDAPLCAELLKKHNVPVIVSAVYRVPQRPSDPYDHAYTLPKRLLDAGIKFCISDTDRSESWNTRNLPFEAGTAVAFGLPEDEALKAVTLYPAQIMNVADRVGSLEPGKDATLIITSGSPLDTRTLILGAYIQGRPVDLSNKQTRLYDKYSQKYLQLKKQTPK